MRKALMLWAVLDLVIGCAASKAAAPAPAPPEPACACRPGWFSSSVPAPWEWRGSKDAGCCHLAFFHIITSAYVEVTLTEAPDPGSFPASVEFFRRQMAGLGYDLTDQPAFLEDAAGRPTAGLHFRGTGEYADRRGKTVLRVSKTPGTILVFLGLWSSYNEAEAEAVFDDLVRHADDLPCGD